MKKLFVFLSAFILSSVVPLYASYCIHCGKQLTNAANFCSNCGHAVYNENMNSYNNSNVTTTTKVIYDDGYSTTSSVRTLSTYAPNSNTQIVYKKEYYYPAPVTQTVVASDGGCDPLLGLMIWGIIHHNHHHHHHRHIAPPPVRHMPPPPSRPSPRVSHSGVRRAGFRH